MIEIESIAKDEKPEVHQEDEWDAPRIDSFQKRFLHKSFLLGEILLSLVLNIVIISLIYDVMGLIGLHLVVSFSKPTSFTT